VPLLYLEYKLCEKFGCLPSELENQPWEKIQAFLNIMDFERQFEEREKRRFEREIGSKHFPKK